MATPPGADDATYVIRSGAGAVERLELIARLFWPSSEDFLRRAGALGAGRFLDVGCGIADVAARLARSGATAVGIDVSAEVVAAAEARNRGSGATLRVAGVDDLGRGDLVDFDVVYARCVISHLPDPVAALEAMLAAARPGGLVLVEDVEVAAVWGSPFDPALARHLELYVAAARALGAHPDVGPDLAVHLRDLGATAVEVDVVQPVLRSPEDLRAHAVTMEAIAGPVTRAGLATDAEVAALVTRLDEWAAEPGTVATLPRVVQVRGRRA